MSQKGRSESHTIACEISARQRSAILTALSGRHSRCRFEEINIDHDRRKRRAGDFRCGCFRFMIAVDHAAVARIREAIVERQSFQFLLRLRELFFEWLASAERLNLFLSRCSREACCTSHPSKVGITRKNAPCVPHQYLLAFFLINTQGTSRENAVVGVAHRFEVMSSAELSEPHFFFGCDLAYQAVHSLTVRRSAHLIKALCQ